MYKRSKSYKSSASGDFGDYWRTVSTPKAPTELVDRNLMGVSPLKEQFEPTEAMPISNRKRMGGAG